MSTTSRRKVLLLLFMCVVVVCAWFLTRATFGGYAYDYFRIVSFRDSTYSVIRDDPSVIHRIVPNKFIYHDRSKPIRVYSNAHTIQMRWLLSSRAVNVLCDIEPYNKNDALPFDLILTTKPNTGRDTAWYFPAWSMAFPGTSFAPIDLTRPIQPSRPADKCCVFLYSNCNDKNFEGVRARQELFRALRAVLPVDAPGKCENNMPMPPRGREQSSFMDDAIQLYSTYRFVIAVENTFAPGYITEKLLLPLLAGSIPIYMGAPDVHEQFNRRRFVSVRDFPSTDACVQAIVRLERDPAARRKMLAEPILASPQVLAQYVGWYDARSTFFEWLYRKFPHWQCPVYTPHRDTWKSLDPSKPIKVINLEKSVDRWKAMQQQFSKFPDLRYERFAAVDGARARDAFPVDSQKHRININPFAQLGDGEIGVYLSNLELWYALVHDPKNDYYLVLEDDAILLDTLRPIDAYARDAPSDWDVLFVGYNTYYCKLDDEDRTPYARLAYGCMPGHFGYMIRKRAAQFYLNFALPIEVPIDEFQRMQARNLNIYVCATPGVTTDYDNDSTIEKK